MARNPLAPSGRKRHIVVDALGLLIAVGGGPDVCVAGT